MAKGDHTALKMLVAVLVSIIAWAYVVYNHNPMTNIRYTNVPVRVVGEDALADRGYGVKGISYDEIYVILNQKRVDCGRISSSNISVTADVSEAVEGDNGISLDITGPDGTQVVESETHSITVQVEEAETMSAEVYVLYADAADEGVEPLVTKKSVNKATIVGAGSSLDSVDKVVAYINSSETAAGPRSYTRDLVAIDANGKPVSHAIIYPEKLDFNAEQGYIETVKLNVNVVDRSNDGYERTYEAPDTVTVKGSKSSLEGLSSIETDLVDITYLYEDAEIELSYDLPEGIYLTNDFQPQVVSVKVTEKKKEEPEKTDDGN